MDPRSGIENTLNRYAWAYDMDELDLIADCFATDAEVEFMDSGWKVGRDEVAGEMRRRRQKYPEGTVPWHVITNVWITDETEDRATVRSWWTFFIQDPDGSQRLSGVGWYDDVFALEDGAWRVKRRRVRKPHHR
jgi:hypothetical protein